MKKTKKFFMGNVVSGGKLVYIAISNIRRNRSEGYLTVFSWRAPPSLADADETMVGIFLVLGVVVFSIALAGSRTL